MTKAIARFYRENPRMISSPFGGVEGVARDLFDAVFTGLNVPLDGQRILDVGCGRGFVGDLVHERGGAYTGLDLIASRNGFPLVLGSGETLPFANAAFHGLFCLDAFEHMPHPERAAAEFRRVLKPGGFVFLSAPNYSNVAGAVKKTCEALRLCPKNSWAPFGRWQPQEWETLLTARRVRRVFQRAGFQLAARIGHGGEVGLGLFPWIDHPRMPDAIRFRLQRAFQFIGPPLAAAFPATSLHNFWKWEAP